ncbi:MAG TPA: outer membrane beta-barrel protein [Kiritimatiellia bacterium]|nr:outer membrane beta-barrel protein [Kiritimatiellia bacterium]
MKWTKWTCALLFVVVALPSVVLGVGSAANRFQVVNRLRFEYDDNIYQEETDTDSSFKIIEEIEFLVNFSFTRTFVSVRYRPNYVWWQNREPDHHDFNHDVDFVLNQNFSPRVTFSLTDTLRRGEIPESVDDNRIVREQDNFTYNAVNGTLGLLVMPQTKLEAAGRYLLLRYDNQDVADTEDFDLYVAGLTVRHQLVPETTLIGEMRGEEVSYEGPDRGSQSYYVGGGVEQTFSPNLLGSVRGGYQEKTFNDDNVGNESSPYVDLAVTFVPSPATRITANVGYSLFETDIYPYASQQRTLLAASLAHDLTARISFYLSGGYTIGDYSADQSVEPGAVTDGSEDLIQVSTRVTYKLNRSNYLEAGWQYQDFSSDVSYVDGSGLRSSYERNRIDAGWKVEF